MKYFFSKRRAGIAVWGLLSVLALVLVFERLAWAQAETAQVNGTVTDPSGAVVANVNVTVRNLGTGGLRVLTTDNRGYYAATNLQTGEYAVTVEVTGFQKQERKVTLNVGGRAELNFQLAIGSATTTVEVVGEGAARVDTETQTIGTVVDNKELSELPTLTRNAYDFAANVGTAANTDPSGRGVGVAFNGLRSAGTNVLLDGAANNDEFGAGVGQAVPLDSVTEYTVLTNNFTAEFGRAAAGVVNVATKGGSNVFHGSLYEYNRVSHLASNGYENNAFGLTKPVYTRNQFGYSIGGPIKKDKLFFFNNIEWFRIRSTANNIVYTFDPALVALAATPTTNYFSQFGKIRSGAQLVQTLTRGSANGDPCPGAVAPDPCGSLPMTTPTFDQYAFKVPGDSGAGLPSNQYQIVGRMDWNLSDRTTLYGRYALQKDNYFPGTVSYSLYSGFDTGETDTNNSFLLSLTHQLSNRSTSQSKIVFNRLNDFQPLGPAPIIPGLYFNPSVATGWNGFDFILPGYLPYTPGNGIPFGGPQNFLQAYQDFSYVKGSHDFRFGASYNYLRDNRTFGAYETPVAAFASSGGIVDASMDNFLNGDLGWFQGAINPQGKFPCGATVTLNCEVTLPVGPPSYARSNRYNEFALYAQDAWKMKPRLTLNLGIRWEYFGVQHSKHANQDSNFYLANAGSVFNDIRNGLVATVPTSPFGGLWHKEWHDFSPRLGFAWDIFGDGKTALRGGYGISYERNFGNVTFNVIQNPPNYAVISITPADVGGPIPVTTNPAGPLAGTSGVKALPKVSLRAVNPNISTDYAHTYSMTLERQFGQGVVIGVDYSGSKGEHLYDIANINRLGSGNYYLGDPCTAYPCADYDFSDLTRLKTTQYSNINYRSSNGNSIYNAMVARIKVRNLKNSGLTLDANWTWSHAYDDLSDTFSSSGNDYNLGYLDPFNPRVDWGPAQFDIRSHLNVQAVWDIPYGKDTKGVVKQIVGGWTIAPIFTAQTGSPFSIFDCTNAYTVCMRAVPLSGVSIPSTGPKNPTLIGTDTFNYISLVDSSGNSLFDSSYVDPITGLSDFGPYPARMSGRDFFYTPGTWNINLGIYKSFFLTERFKLTFRGEMYNAFNHANLYAQTGNADVSYPEITAYRSGNRNVQLALRVDF